MIRRAGGDSLLLITQHDHALLAGRLAAQLDGASFPRPEPYEQTIRGIMLHDCGWPLHDDRPTLNAQGMPLDVFESPRNIALPVWAASAERAAQGDPYAGLLASLHVLSLSVYALTQAWSRPGKYSAADVFDTNKFQQREVERQVTLRQRLGLRTDRPLSYGLWPHDGDQAEDQLRANLRLLQAMDQLSLAICCTEPPMPRTGDVIDITGGNPLSLDLQRRGDDLTVSPWPFAPDDLAVQVPARRVRRRYESPEQFRADYANAEVLTLSMRLTPGR